MTCESKLVASPESMVCENQRAIRPKMFVLTEPSEYVPMPADLQKVER